MQNTILFLQKNTILLVKINSVYECRVPKPESNMTKTGVYLPYPIEKRTKRRSPYSI
jgi:hypothetical protein